MIGEKVGPAHLHPTPRPHDLPHVNEEIVSNRPGQRSLTDRQVERLHDIIGMFDQFQHATRQPLWGH